MSDHVVKLDPPIEFDPVEEKPQLVLVEVAPGVMVPFLITRLCSIPDDTCPSIVRLTGLYLEEAR